MNQYDVFISFKNTDDDGKPTRDSQIAGELRDELTRRGLRVFFSNESLRQLGAADFGREIDEALEDADVLVLIGTLEKHLKGEWVRHEYETFQQLIRNRRKPNGRLFVYSEGLPLDKLPVALMRQQVVEHDAPTSFDELFEFIIQGLIGITGDSEREPDEGEWMVPEARERPEFIRQIGVLHDFVQRQIDDADAEVVMTLYGRSFKQEGVGTYEYDLIYYRNIHDDAPMFGPLVKDDDRDKFAKGNNKSDVGIPVRAKPGGFIEREEIHSYAKFKLSRGLWGGGGPDAGEAADSPLAGLLFINGRKFPIPEHVFKLARFQQSLEALTGVVSEICDRRRQNSSERLGTIFGNLPGPLREPSPDSIHSFFKALVHNLHDINGHGDTVYSAYVYTEDSGANNRRLHWLWSNSPTSAPATLHLSQTRNSDSLLIADVALDPNNKPLLVHDVPRRKPYLKKLVRTRLAEDSRANLVIPVLSVEDDPRLLGVLDIQSQEPQRFDADDIQLFYALARFLIAGAFESVRAVLTSGIFPLRNDGPYQPFDRQPLDFSVLDLLALAFNPMKFLLHWDQIRELITTGRTEKPATVEVWPNMKCNHKCSWCRTEPDRRMQQRYKNEMTSDELRGIANDLKALGQVDVLISGGGEPLLHPAIHEFMELIRDHDGNIGIFTNGTRPVDFRFWESFLHRTDSHRFIRLSFNGHDPESYFRIHFNAEMREQLPTDHRERYAEARKTVLDLLGLRSGRTSVAIGDTVQHHELQYVRQKSRHASGLGVDFIQMRPELRESANFNERGADVCNTVQEIAGEFTRPDFAVVHTDGERSFVRHTEPRCYAMQLVPTLVPDSEPGWTRIMPCSYAINNFGTVPDLGRMREGASLSEFWKRMNQQFDGQDVPEDAAYEVTIEEPIDPTRGCPQCRYFRLNQRVSAPRRRGRTPGTH